METMLQAVVVVFMLFLCSLCLFAVIVIVRDIIYENAKTRREREAERANAEAPVHEPVQVVVQPAPVVVPAPAPVAEPAPVVETKVEEPVREEESAPEDGEAEEVAATEDDPDAVSFSRVSLTM